MAERRAVGMGPSKNRDPARVARILSKLALVWEAHPDLRLGQLVVNTTGKSDPFSVEDDETERRLDAWIDTGTCPPAGREDA
jgi:hypothetical protein